MYRRRKRQDENNALTVVTENTIVGINKCNKEYFEYVADRLANGNTVAEIAKDETFWTLLPASLRDKYYQASDTTKNSFIYSIFKTKEVGERFIFLRQMYNINLQESGMMTYAQRRRMLAEIATDYEVDVDTRMRAIAMDATLSGDIKVPPNLNQSKVDVVVNIIDKIKNRKQLTQEADDDTE